MINFYMLLLYLFSTARETGITLPRVGRRVGIPCPLGSACFCVLEEIDHLLQLELGQVGAGDVLHA
jgi:hypothetical protein